MGSKKRAQFIFVPSPLQIQKWQENWKLVLENKANPCANKNSTIQTPFLYVLYVSCTKNRP